MSDSDNDDIPPADECERRSQEFAKITGTDTALAMFYLQDRKWELDVSTPRRLIIDMNKEWICSGRPITLCAIGIAKAWVCHGSRIWPKCDVTSGRTSTRKLQL